MEPHSPLDLARAEEALLALGEQLASDGASFDLVVIGGAALLALGLTTRVTGDVDVVGLRRGVELIPADPFPEALSRARDRVARDLGLRSDRLNPGPADLARLGLPNGFLERATSRAYGQALTVRFTSRVDQIHFKLYAMVDQGGGRHEQDLRALEPTPDELLLAARWTRTHDPSVGFRAMLVRALAHLGVHDADVGT